MTTNEQRIKKEIFRLHEIDMDRSIYVTPYEGAYGIAGYVITVEGSPPKGTLFLVTMDGAIDSTMLKNDSGKYAAYHYQYGEIKRIDRAYKWENWIDKFRLINDFIEERFPSDNP